MRRRLLHVIVSLEPSGAEKMLVRLANTLAEAPGFEQVIVTLAPYDPDRHLVPGPGIEVHALDMSGLRSVPGGILRLCRLLRWWKPDAVQTWMYHSDLLGGTVARLCGIKNLYWGVRIADVSKILSVSTRWVVRFCIVMSHVVPRRIVCCAQSAEETHRRLGYRAGALITIPNGYDFSELQYSDANRARARTAFGVDDSRIVVEIVARFHIQKDFPTLVEAARQLCAANDSVDFVLIGQSVDRENADLMRWIEATGFADRFHLLGFRSDVAALLSGFDIFWLTSITEGFPNALAEAMATGLPCVSTDVGGAGELLQDGGFLVPASQPDALARAVQRLIDMGPAERRALGQRACRTVHENFSIHEIAKRYADLYACE